MQAAPYRPPGRFLAAVLCAACLLSTSCGAVSRAVAEDAWETWPKKAPEPAVERKAPSQAAEPGKPDGSWVTWPVKPPAASTVRIPPAKEKEEEKEKDTGRSFGTVGWIALGIAAAVGIGIAVSSGGGGDGGGTVLNPGHQ